jgi:hypothetical protein
MDPERLMPINSLPVRQEVTAEVLRVLTNNCAFLNSIGREHEKYFEEKVPIGTTLQIKRPWKPLGRTGQAFQPEAIVQTTVPLVISYWDGGDFIYNDTDEALFLDMNRYHEDYSRPMGVQIANKVDGNLAAFTQQTVPNFVGTPGQIPGPTNNGLQTYTQARIALNKLLAADMDRSVIWTSDFEGGIVGANQTLFNPSQVIGREHQTGVVGRYAGFDFMRDEQIPGFTAGTWAGAGQVNGANQSGSSLITNNWTSSSVSVVAGDRFTIAGVYKVNPQGGRTSYSGASNLMQFVVTQAGTDTTGAITLQIYPPLIPAGQFQNCSGSPANGAAITFATTSGQVCNTAFALQKEAYTAAFLKLHKPTGTDSVVMGGEEAGTSGIYIRNVKQWQSSGPYAGYETDRSDIIYGFANQYGDYFSTVIYG